MLKIESRTFKEIENSQFSDFIKYSSFVNYQASFSQQSFASRFIFIILLSSYYHW